jgi:hypothetical protein
MKADRQFTTAGTPHYEALVNRREFLLRGGGGFGALALAWLMRNSPLNQTLAAAPQGASALAPRAPHFPAKAKSVIFLFMEGGPSHIDLFDPKPLLNKLAGQKLPPSFGPIITAMGEVNAPLLESRRAWKQHGQSGIWVSDWLPHTAECVDDMAVIRSCWADGLNHANGVCQMNTGSVLGGRPSLGSWVTYGMGSENSNLPAFLVLCDNNGQVVGGPRNWGSGFMPAVYQGVRLQGGNEPIPNLGTPEGIDPLQQQSKIDFLHQVNRRHAQLRPDYDELDARIQSYELAFRMQAEAPEAVDLSQENQKTLELYGIDQNETAPFGRLCLLARRMVERGVRFVQLYHGTGSKWDAHSAIERNHTEMCRSSDKPVAGLLKDLKQRGLLEETLVIWGGEFGRTPMSEKGDGRDHNPTGFTMWLAGGGVKGGQVIGETDDLGLHATKDRLHVHDFHATIMHLLGMDHTQVIYTHQGRPERVDVNEGMAYRKITGA